MHITLTGNLGSGKSTVCKILESVYGYEIYSTGVVQRELALERGISVYEMNQLMRQDHSYDNMIDERTTQKSREDKSKNIVFDSRLAWHFAEDTFKVFMSVNINEAATRVFNDSRGEVEKYSSVEDAKEYLVKRAQAEDVRYHEIYNLDYFNFNNYDLIIDSTYCTPGILSRIIIEEAAAFYEDKQKGLTPEQKILFSPKRLGYTSEKHVNAPGFYKTEPVTLTKDGDDYRVIEGAEYVQAAAQEGFLFVKANIR